MWCKIGLNNWDFNYMLFMFVIIWNVELSEIDQKKFLFDWNGFSVFFALIKDGVIKSVIWFKLNRHCQMFNQLTQTIVVVGWKIVWNKHWLEIWDKWFNKLSVYDSKNKTICLEITLDFRSDDNMYYHHRSMIYLIFIHAKRICYEAQKLSIVCEKLFKRTIYCEENKVIWLQIREIILVMIVHAINNIELLPNKCFVVEQTNIKKDVTVITCETSTNWKAQGKRKF